MQEPSICKSTDHLFLPLLEVHAPLLRCVHCNVFAYHETVKQLAKKRAYRVDDEDIIVSPEESYWRRAWSRLRQVLAQ